MRVTYNRHHHDEPQGHLFLADAPEGEACTITLTPAACASQEWLDAMGTLIAEALKGRRWPHVAHSNRPRPFTRNEDNHYDAIRDGLTLLSELAELKVDKAKARLALEAFEKLRAL